MVCKICNYLRYVFCHFFVLKISVADPHHVDADPDPSFQIKARNPENVLK
jgi:hypothetical protein